jgi:hypothetical protein
MPFILPARTLDSGFNIDNSLRFNSGDSADLRFTPSSAGTEETFTISAWIKKSMVGSSNGNDTYLFASQADSNNRTIMGVWGDSGGIFFENKVSGTSSTVYEVAKRRDPSAWYHCVWAIDTSQGTDTNRVKLYVNGVQSTLTGTYVAEDVVTQWSKAQVNYIGSRAGGNYYDGYMAEVHVIDGTQKAASDFGETNDNGIWIPKKYTGTYGANGYYLEFKQTGTSANASGIGADTSGNTSHWTPTNLAAVDVATDSPTNNFCTLNPLNDVAITYTEGNLHAINNGAAGTATGTMAPSNGKWYLEMELAGAANFGAGVVNLDAWPSKTNIYPYTYSAMVLIESNANYNVTYGNTASGPTTLQNSTDLVTAKYGFAIDIDNNDLYVSANGNWYTGSAFDNTSFGSATAVTTDLPSGVPLTFVMRNPDGVIARCNFGNPGGDDSIASGNADANGYGNFEYAVPSGYFSLCTKNLAEYG